MSEAETSESQGHEKAPAAPILSDGIGLSYEEIAQELTAKSKTIVSADDPILMMVPICNAFLAQQQALQDRHKMALAQVMADKTDSFVQSVQKAVEELANTLTFSTVESLQSSFSAQQNEMQQHEKVLQQHKSNMAWLAAITTVSALVNVAVFVGIFLLKG
ncbi:MAG: hypothetical protein GX087_05270 [Desulfobulbaceae bacterium]|nr:hypothetical protein [Desulfobulbaceae bacterium]